jgi:hypothetical protein
MNTLEVLHLELELIVFEILVINVYYNSSTAPDALRLEEPTKIFTS